MHRQADAPSWQRSEATSEMYKPEDLLVYTDGSCYADGKLHAGGWGAAFLWNGMERHISGAALGTTISVMEVTAILRAAEELPVGSSCRKIIISDSEYAVDCLTSGVPQYRRNGWVGASGADIEHRELLEQTYAKLQEVGAAVRWCRGHAGIYGNELADKLARAARLDITTISLIKETVDDMAATTTKEVGVSQWVAIAERHAQGLMEVARDSRGWASKSPIMLWTYYLGLSYLYYSRDITLIPDSEFDNLCRYLNTIGKEGMKEHGAYWIDELWDDSAISAGTGYQLGAKVPMGVMNIADVMWQKMGQRTFHFATDPASYLPSENRSKRNKRPIAPVQEAPKPVVRQRVRKPLAVRQAIDQEVKRRVRVRAAATQPTIEEKTNEAVSGQPAPRTRTRTRAH